MSEDREQDRGFTVKDRRRFSDTGEARAATPEEDAKASPAAAEEASAASPSASEAGASGATAREADVLPEITLATFIMSLSTQALLHMGEIPGPAGPGGEKTERDMTAAKQVIDILGLLREKTSGNLDANEEALFDNVLYDLRMRYVELSRR